jgi:hypothetical protein
MSAPEDNIPAMVAALTLADVERNDTVNVLMRQGWRSREIAAVIDEVERRVREIRKTMEPPILGALVALAAVMALPDPAAAAEAAIEAPWTLGPVGAALLGLACIWIGAVVAIVAVLIAKARREDTYPILVKRGNHWPCRLAISEDRIICRECGEDSTNGTLPGCVMGKWSR